MSNPGFSIGDKVLITTNEWFTAPDGATYKAVHGTVKAIISSEEALGVKTNSKSTNWYVSIGDMLVAGCQIHYAVKTERCNFGDAKSFTVHEGKSHVFDTPCAIYNADEVYE